MCAGTDVVKHDDDGVEVDDSDGPRASSSGKSAACRVSVACTENGCMLFSLHFSNCANDFSHATFLMNE